MRSVLLALLFVAPITWAGQQNAVRSCYDIARMDQHSAPTKTALFVAIDQTTPLDAGLQQSIQRNIFALLQPQTSFSVSRFSAYTQGYYMETLVSGKLDSEIDSSARDDISKTKLRGFDNCMRYQLPYARKLVASALQQTFSNASDDIAKSDVMASLKDLSSAIKATQADRKLLLIASDMLENSSVSSFYANHAVRRIDPTRELSLAQKAGLIGDFDGADIYVIGAGLLSGDNQKAYRDPQTMRALQDFWQH